MKRLAPVLLLVLTACFQHGDGGVAPGDDDDDGSTGTPTATATPTGTAAPYGGGAFVSRMRYEGSGTTTESASAMAYFYEPVPPGDFALQPIDTCVTPVPVSSPAPTPAPLNYYDAGSEVTLSGASSIPLPKTVNGEFLYYLPAGTLSPASVPANGTWSVSWTGGPDLVAGSLSNAVELPASFVFSSPSFATAVTLSGAINLAWSTSGSAPGDAVWIYVSAGSGSATCRVTDDGAFTIPSSIIASLPSGSGVLGGYRIRSNEPVLPNGTRVFTYGMWSHYGAATKP